MSSGRKSAKNQELNLIDEDVKTVGLRDYFGLFSQKVSSDHLDLIRPLEDLIKKYDESSHPAAKHIIQLIGATIKFHSETDPNFSMQRDANISDERVVKRLNRMAKTITRFESYTKEVLDKSDHDVVDHALAFCKDSIKSRMATLNENKDRIYKLFQTSENKLKLLLKDHPSVSSAPKKQ